MAARARYQHSLDRRLLRSPPLIPDRPGRNVQAGSPKLLQHRPRAAIHRLQASAACGPSNKNSANPGRTIWSVLLLSDLCQSDQCRRVGSAWPACYGCDQGVIAMARHGSATPISARHRSMIAVSRDLRIHPLSRCATRRLSTVKTGIARLDKPLFPYPTPFSTASTYSTPSTFSTVST